MIQALKFVRGAVAKKDYQPALTHFRINNGRITGYNGIIALSSPIDLEITATPKATPFVKAIERCNSDTTVVHLTPGGKLGLSSGKFRAYVECTEETEILDGIVPEGNEVDIATSILPALRVLEPYIATDASRQWATGILLHGESAFATNNIVVAEYWVGAPMPTVNLPSVAIEELIRIGEEPTAVQMSENTVTFHFAGDRWMRTQRLGVDWPDVYPILQTDLETYPLPPGFYEAIELLAPFVETEGRVYFREGRMATSPQEESERSAASVEISGLPGHGAYNYKHLLSLKDRATAINFSAHPKPCPFVGDRLRGVIVGMVDA